VTVILPLDIFEREMMTYVRMFKKIENCGLMEVKYLTYVRLENYSRLTCFNNLELEYYVNELRQLEV
jgi:hypothetical protein